jgi:hypothetical protein
MIIHIYSKREYKIVLVSLWGVQEVGEKKKMLENENIETTVYI